MKRAPRSRERAGLTLPELTVAVAILGLGLLLAAPALPRARRGSDAVAHQVARALGRARQAAVQTGQPYRVELDVPADALRIYTADHRGADSLTAETRLRVPAHVRLAPGRGGDRYVAHFGALGRAEADTLRVWDEDGASGWLTVDRWTGAIDVTLES